MRKRVFGFKLGRGKGARRALFRSVIRALVAHGLVKTTKAKAKAVRSDINKIVGLSKEGGVTKRRQVYALLGNDRVTTDHLFRKIAPQLKDRPGGYTRTINLPRRRGDMAEMVRLEWVKEIVKSDKRQVTRKKKKEEVKGSFLKKRLIKLPGRKTTKKETSVRK